MLNQNYQQDLRYCEKTQNSQTFLHLDMFQKKIRKRPQYAQDQIDADMKMRQIHSFWKQNWHYEHFHPIFINPVSINPTIVIDQQITSLKQYQLYNKLIQDFSYRLKIQSDDQHTYKIIKKKYLSFQQCQSLEKYPKFQKIIQQSIQNALNFTVNMKKSIVSIEEIGQYNNQYGQVIHQVIDFCKVQLKYVLKYFSKKEGMTQQKKENLFEEIMKFCINFRQSINTSLQNKKSSVLFTPQPKIDSFTYLIHPIILAIELYIQETQNQMKQIHQILRKRRQGFESMVTEEEIMKVSQDSKQQEIDQEDAVIKNQRRYRDLQARTQQDMSRILFINFDGYQSEFNLQYARKLNDRLMYISFPKQKSGNISHSKRFYKKYMPNYAKTDQDQIEDQILLQKQRLENNPENYHDHLEEFLLSGNEKYNLQTLNNNVFVFPLKSQYLKEKFIEQMETKQSMEPFQSHLVRGIFRNYLISQIRNFSPSLIIVSYSGRLSIEESHMIELIQQITKLSNYKLILFPNLTTHFCAEFDHQKYKDCSKEVEEKEKIEQEQSQQMPQYQFLNDRNINFRNQNNFYDSKPENQQMSVQNQESQTSNSLDFLSFLSKFLKISSGTYNLNFHLQEESLISKYKNSKIFKYIYQLFTVLGKEYSRIKNIKSSKTQLNFQYDFYQQKIHKPECGGEAAIQKSVSLYYKTLYRVIETLLFKHQQKQNEGNQKEELEQLKINPDDYTEIMENLRYMVVKNQKHDSQLGLFFNEQKFLHYLQLSSSKFQEKINIYIKSMRENQYFKSEIGDKEDKMSSLTGIYFLTFYNENRQNIRIDENTSILYKTDQMDSQYFHVLILNNDSFQGKYLKNYYALVKKNNIYYKFQRCQTYDVNFYDQNNVLIQNHPFKIYTKWNYAQTADFIFLFWPSIYDYIQAVTAKMTKRKYQPYISDEIFVAKKVTKTNKGQQMKFKRINYLSQFQIEPRSGVSVYECFGKLFIFGGFYGNDKNYLNLQHDITVFDLANFDFEDQAKVAISNEKMRLFSSQTMNSIRLMNGRVNSFARSRRQYQFFDKNQLRNLDDISQEQINQESNDECCKQKKVIMIGGYGQNFLRPYSLLTSHYYEIKFSQQSRNIVTIEKKLVYNRAIPINIKGMMKNKGYYQKMNVFDEGDQMIKLSNATQQHYLFHRVAYCFDKQNNLDFKIKTFYAIQQFSSLKQTFRDFAKQLGQDKTYYQSQQINLVHISQTKNYIMINQGERKFIVGIYYQMGDTQVKLTNQSVISMDINNNKVFAIIKHSCYTQDKSVLAICDIVFPQYQITQDQVYNISDTVIPIVLKKIKVFTKDLSMHNLVTCNKKLLLLLHGPLINQNYGIQQYSVKIKYVPQNQNHQVASLASITPVFLKQAANNFCQSFFLKKDMRIQCYSFFYSGVKNFDTLRMMYQIINVGQIKYNWHLEQNWIDIIFMISRQNSQHVAENVHIIELRKSMKQCVYFGVKVGQKQMRCKLSDQRIMEWKGKKVYVMSLENIKRDKQWDESYIGKIVHKSFDKYEDLL